MELRVIHYFLAVVQEKTISGAAKQLHVSQPTLSKQLTCRKMNSLMAKSRLVAAKQKLCLF